jgi:glycosyltransferase involved in cell wall biosynthesis
LAKGIDPQKYSITVCFVGVPGPLMDDFQTLGISTRIVPWRHPHRDPLGLLGLCRQLTQEHFDIVHAHWGGRGVRWVASRIGRAKVLFHLHGRVNERNGAKPILVPTDNADAVIAVSRAVASASLHKNTKKIYTGVEVLDVAPAATNAMTIGTIGRLLPLKGIVHLLRAISTVRGEFPDVRLEIVGDGPQRSDLQQQIIELGLKDTVSLLGWLPEVNSAMANWHIFVQPSLEEGLPVALLEAMAAGLPVIASAVGGIPEIVEDGVTGRLVAPGDPVALAQSLREMLLNVELRQRLGRAARLRIRRHFSSEAMVRQISEVYDELLTS